MTLDRVLVTGAAGFVGSHFVRSLLRQSHATAILVPDPVRIQRVRDVLAAVTVMRGDLTWGAELAAQVSPFEPDTMVHFAWRGVHGPGRVDGHLQRLNVAATLGSVEIARRTGCRLWVGIGSQEEYRRHTAYGGAKRAAALAAQERCRAHGIRFLWLRLFAAYGPDDHCDRLVPYLTLELLRGRRPRLTGGEQSWDFLYVDDVAEAITTAAARGCAGEFDLGSGDSVPVREVAERVRDLIDPRSPLGFGEIPYRDGEPVCWRADPGPLAEACGWRRRTALADGLSQTVAWFRKHHAPRK